MRLIHTHTLELHTFFDTRLPEYAILSHTWGDNEIDLQAFARRDNMDSHGWKKIQDCCQLARAQSLEWAWVDTCCIDKTSSAELSEAINSMYRWYQRAAVCYAFLSDYDPAIMLNNGMSLCRWFTRGWTLQELLAPQNVLFYDKSMQFIGTRTSLAEEISGITRIETAYLEHTFLVRKACNAEKMFWASRRETTRIEDQAYCLLGLFDVNMPLLYGEREKAFTRLQQEIIARSSDESIFAWTVTDQNVARNMTFLSPNGMLAESPADFADSGGLHTFYGSPARPPSAVTNRGVEFPVALFASRTLLDTFVPSPVTRLSIPLACGNPRGPASGARLAVTLVRESEADWLWKRVVTTEHHFASRNLIFHEIEAVVGGYKRIIVAPHTSDSYWPPEDSPPLLFANPVFRILAMDTVMILCGLALVTLALHYPQLTKYKMGTATTVLFQWVVLSVYWRFWKQNLRSVILLILPVAFDGWQHAIILLAYLLSTTLVHVIREYRRR